LTALGPLIVPTVVLQVQRSVVGRLMADPAFAQKLLIEQFITVAASLTWEASQRRERFWKEFDLVAINTLCLQAANASLVGS
jgi:Protein RETICULATA-related